MLKRWFVRKYKMPVTHSCYTSASMGEWLEEMYADLYAEQEQTLYALEQLDQAGMQPKALEAERRRLHAEIERLSEALGETKPPILVNTVIDDIEARMARGETDIDLSVLLPKGWKPPKQ